MKEFFAQTIVDMATSGWSAEQFDEVAIDGIPQSIVEYMEECILDSGIDIGLTDCCQHLRTVARSGISV